MRQQTRIGSTTGSITRPNEALRSLGRDLSELRGASEAKNLAALKKLVAPEQWLWAEPHAISFVRFAADLMPIDVLGDHAGFLLRGSAVRSLLSIS
jgi:hypothetical protein